MKTKHEELLILLNELLSEKNTEEIIEKLKEETDKF